jgi:hypothetical protein
LLENGREAGVGDGILKPFRDINVFISLKLRLTLIVLLNFFLIFIRFVSPPYLLLRNSSSVFDVGIARR